MYEEIVKQLRKQHDDMDCGNCNTCVKLQAADAIEELQYDLDIAVRAEAAATEACKPRWIPVTERLPEEGVSVQVCFLSQGGKAQAVSERFVDNRNQSYWSGLCGMKPTYWMPLPEPPKEEA